jgi:hypothetical protein
MKKTLFILFSLNLALCAFGQDVKEANTKLEKFISKTGVIIKYEDYNLNDIKLTYGFAKSKIRKVTNGDATALFYQISKEGKYDTKTASIAYEDLLEMQKALSSLKSQSESDSTTSSDYIENKFVTDDGFQVGYFVNKSKVNWYIMLEKYGSGNTIFIKDFSIIEDAFNSAKTKMEELN